MSEQTTSPAASPRAVTTRVVTPRLQHALGLVLVLLAVGYRGAQFVDEYAEHPQNLGHYDTRFQYAAAHAWLDGKDPYDFTVIEAYAPQNEIALAPYPYPPNTLPLIAPLGAFDYDQSRYVLAAVNVLSIMLIAGLLLWVGLWFTRRRGIAWGILAAWAGAAITLAQSVGVVNVWLGQLTSPPAALAVLGMTLACFGRVIPGAGIAALSTIKPQLVVFLIPMLVARWPKRATIALAVVGALSVLPALITLGFPDLITDWLAAVDARAQMEANAPGSPVTFGIRYLLFDLGWPMIEVAPAGLALLALAWLYRRRLGDFTLLSLTLPVSILFFPAMEYYQVVATPIFALLLWHAAGRLLTLAVAVVALIPAVKVLPPLLPGLAHREQELWLLGITLVVMALACARPEPAAPAPTQPKPPPADPEDARAQPA